MRSKLAGSGFKFLFGGLKPFRALKVGSYILEFKFLFGGLKPWK